MQHSKIIIATSKNHNCNIKYLCKLPTATSQINHCNIQKFYCKTTMSASPPRISHCRSKARCRPHGACRQPPWSSCDHTRVSSSTQDSSTFSFLAACFNTCSYMKLADPCCLLWKQLLCVVCFLYSINILFIISF